MRPTNASANRAGHQRSTFGLPVNVVDNAGLVATVTEKAECFIFSYAPRLKTLLSWSDNARAVLGVGDAQIIRDGNVFMRFVHDDDRFRVLSALERALKDGCSYQCTYRWVRPDNDQIRFLHCRAAASSQNYSDWNVSVSGELGNAAIIDGVIFDLGTSPESVGRSDSIWAQVQTGLSTWPGLAFLLDEDLRVVWTSTTPKDALIPHAVRSHAFNFGDPAFDHQMLESGRPFLNAFKDDAARVRVQRLLTELAIGKATRHRLMLGEGAESHQVTFSSFGDRNHCFGILAMVEDARNLSELQQEVKRLRRAESFQSLAAGISHHVNNAFQAIIGQATMLGSAPDDPELVRRASLSIIDLVRKSSEYTSKLFALDDPSRAPPSAVDLNLIVLAAVSGIEKLFASSLDVQVVFGNPLPVLARQEQLVQAIQGILANAREHAHSEVRRTFVLTTSHAVQDAANASFSRASSVSFNTALNRGPFSKLEIVEQIETVPRRSSGPQERNNSAEEPPEVRKARLLIEEIGGGFVDRGSWLGRTEIAIYLPALDHALTRTPENPRTRRAGPPRVLIIDDDSLVLQTVSAILIGESIECAGSATCKHALQLAEKYRDAIEIVLIDAVMPDEDTSQVARTMRQLLPRASIVGFTGATAEAAHRLKEAGACLVLQKPIDRARLCEALRPLLSAEASRKA